MSSIPLGYFEDEIGKLSLHKTSKGYKLDLDLQPVGRLLDIAQDALDAQVWQDVQRYMPVDTGALKSETAALNAVTRGEVYMYHPDSAYGHYQYEGKVYIDPVYRKAAFYSPEYGFWSRPGVQKVESERFLTYSQPDATMHWGEVAFDNHGDEWLDVVRRCLEK